MLHPSDISKSTVRLTCGSEMGTGFFLADGLILTARHVVLDRIEDSAPIRAAVSSETGEVREANAELVADSELHDIALLEYTGESGPPLAGRLCFARIGEEWRTYGFPAAAGPDGSCFHGTVEQYTPSSCYDLILYVNEDISAYDYSGLSGSPLVLGDFAVGVVVSQNGPKLSAVSLLSLDEFLNGNGISVERESSYKDLPGDLQGLSQQAVPNDNVTRKLATALPNAYGRILLLHGPPGSGKTVQVANYTPDTSENCEIIGKFFIRVPSDSVLPARRASTDFFLDWMRDAIHIALAGIPPEVSSAPLEQRASEIATWLYDLGRALDQQGKHGVLAIDGIDDLSLYGSSPESFLAILSSELPPNICVLLSCTSKSVLPSFLRHRIHHTCEVEIDPLSQEECYSFLEMKLAGTGLSAVQLRKVAERTEGHPLYMHYLIESVKGKSPIEDFDTWLDNVPTIAGDIQTYYELIWDTSLAGSPSRVWTMATMARLRHPISSSELYEMLPESAQMSFPDTMPSLSHLLRVGGRLEIYHSSFTAFINSKTSIQSKDIHDKIARYCDNFPDSEYAVPNCIHHHACSSIPTRAIERCHQEWADKCALRFIAPDLVLSDARTVELLAMESEDLPEFIRIKLLLQRLRFRYNNDLPQNAFSMADTLITLGAPHEAMRYLIRQGHLIASNDDALYLLQKLYEKESGSAVRELQRAIDDRYIAGIEKWRENGAIEFSDISLGIGSIVLLSHVDRKESYHRYTHLMGCLRRIVERFGEKGENTEDLNLLLDFCSGKPLGYFMWSRHVYPTISEISKQGRNDFDSSYIVFLLAVSQAFFEYQRNSTLPLGCTNDIILLSSDLETLIDKYGIPEEPFHRDALLRLLSEYSGRTDIVEELIRLNAPASQSYRLRAENGVDLDAKSVALLIQDCHYRAYTIDSGNSDVRLAGEESWEPFLLEVLQQASEVLGRCCRMKAESKALPDSITTEVFLLIDRVGFSLKERAKWKRSYALPEEIVPIIYNQFSEFFTKYQEDKLSTYVDIVAARYTKQFGLYTEGTREILLDLARHLCRFPEHQNCASTLICLLKEHVTKAVLNRIERTPLLLQICQLYAQVDDMNSAMDCYQLVLDTSMGPGWYKEDQFSLANTALRLHLSDADLLSQFGDCERYLEYASGELTFQRYVRYAKEELVGSLAANGRVAESIAYLRSQILPSPEVLWQRVTANNTDSLSLGEGYEDGANCVTLPGAVIALLKQCADVNSAIVWSLAEIIIINDDVERYCDSFLDIMGLAIQASKGGVPGSAVKLLERMADIASHAAMKDSVAAISEKVHSVVTPEQYREFLSLLAGHGVVVSPEVRASPPPSDPVSVDDERSHSEGNDRKRVLSGFPGMGTLPSLAKVDACYRHAMEYLASGNKTLARKQILEAFTYMQKHGADMWATNLSHSCGGLMDALVDLSTSPGDFLRVIARFAADTCAEDWRVVDRVLCLLKDRIPHEMAAEINRTVGAHLKDILQPPGDSLFVSSLAGWEGATDREGALCDFIIWLLNFPDSAVRARSYRAIEWLLQVAPEAVVPALVDEALSGLPRNSCELCACLLSSTQNSEVAGIAWDRMKRGKGTLDAMVRLKHFSIKHSLLLLFGKISADDPELASFYSRLQDSVPDYVTTGELCAISDVRLAPLADKLDELNRARILDRSFFLNVDELLAKIGPRGMRYYVQYDHFVDRSFGVNRAHFPPTYQAMVRYALNCALARRVERGVAHAVFSIIALRPPNEI